MTEIIANMNISAPAESFAENKADVNPEAAKPPVNNGSHRASVLHKFFEDLENSAEGTQEVGTFRNSIRSMVDDDGIEEGLDMKDPRGRTLLHIAASEGLAETAKRLIDAGSSLDARDEWGDTPLIDACRAGNNIEVVRLLLGRGAKPDIFSNEGDSPLFKAARNGHSATVQYLLDQVKWDLDIGEKEYDMTPLHAAALSDDRETLRYLRDNGAKLDLLDTDGWTPLMTAINSRNKNSMKELLQKRNDEDLQLGRKDLQERTPILRAAEMGFWDGFRLLRKAGAKWTETESKTTEAADGDSASDMSKKDAALHLAISGNQIDIVEFLLEQGANVNSRGQDGQQPLHLASLRGNTAIMELVLNSKKFNHLDIGDDDRMTPLHLACTADEYDGHYNEAVRLLLDREPKPNMEMKTIDGKTALELAFDSGHDERGLLVLGVFAQESSRISDTLMWAAGKTERHKIAAYLLKGQVKVSPDSSPAKTSKDWTAIEWAAYAREPQALWLLIASSPRSKDTKDVLKSAKALVEKSKKQGKGSVSNPEIQETSQTGVTKKGSKDIKWQEIEDILNNPPIGVMCRDNSTYSLLRCEDKHSSDTYNATIVQFYKTQGRFESIMGSQSIRETIYGRGPADVMDEVVNKLKKLADSHLKGLKESANVQQPIFMNSEPKFTWIHLPATNIVWMNHLLQRIMEDEDESVGKFNQAKSFFKDSWIEIPDKFSVSRTMRPRFVSRDTKATQGHTRDLDKLPPRQSDDPDGRGMEKEAETEETKDTKLGDDLDAQKPAAQTTKDNEDHKINTSSPVAATAIYMPYLSYSFQCAKSVPVKPPQPQTQIEKELVGTKKPRNDKTPAAVQADVEVRRERKTEHQKLEEDKRFDYANKLIQARAKYHKLLDEYRGKIVHGSSTLDESYYHFGADDDSLEDKDKRNRSQVVTESWLRERAQLKEQIPNVQDQQGQTQDSQPQKEPKREKQKQHQQEKGDRSHKLQDTDLYWLLIRANQLWIWTINDRWLISASSHPIDDGEDELLNGILDRLEKQREAAGSESQPGSTAEMSQLIVDYCVETYERKPRAHDDERPEDCRLTGFPSIRQVFSKSINSIARDETKLSEEFSHVTKRLRVRLYETTREHRTARENMDKELAKTTDKAKDLSSSVKDILDELSMLETIVEYQQDVQKAMKRNYSPRTNGKPNILETEYTATYVINDIKRLYGVAERIHSAVNTTVSLHQSETANIQAELSMQQGRVLMVFTVVTILFLPLSFLTSFFALDVASFQQAPPWALSVICVSLINVKLPATLLMKGDLVSVSAAFFIPTVIAAFTWKRSQMFLSDLVSYLMDGFVKLPGYVIQQLKPFIGYLLYSFNNMSGYLTEQAMAFVCFLLELAEARNQTEGDDAGLRRASAPPRDLV